MDQSFTHRRRKYRSSHAIKPEWSQKKCKYNTLKKKSSTRIANIERARKQIYVEASKLNLFKILRTNFVVLVDTGRFCNRHIIFAKIV